MKQNVTVSIGSLALIDKVDCEFEFFRRVFGGLVLRAFHLNSISLTSEVAPSS